MKKFSLFFLSFLTFIFFSISEVKAAKVVGGYFTSDITYNLCSFYSGQYATSKSSYFSASGFDSDNGDVLYCYLLHTSNSYVPIFISRGANDYFVPDVYLSNYSIFPSEPQHLDFNSNSYFTQKRSSVGYACSLLPCTSYVYIEDLYGNKDFSPNVPVVEYSGSLFDYLSYLENLSADEWLCLEPIQISTSSSLVYDEDIGSLMVDNVNQVNHGDTGNLDFVNYITFDSKTSNDYYVTDGYIQYYFVYDPIAKKPFTSSYYETEPYISDKFNLSSGILLLSFNQDTYTDLASAWREQNDIPLFTSYEGSPLSLWCRPVINDKYGDWLVLTEDNGFLVPDTSTVFPGSDEPTPDVPSTNPSTPISSTVNDTPIISSNVTEVDFSKLSSQFKGLFNLLGSWPTMIATIFSWLPDWVIIFLSTSIALCGVIVIIKFIRG